MTDTSDDSITRDTCGTCRWFHANTAVVREDSNGHRLYVGECRRFPPSADPMFPVWAWPDVLSDQWCGEHEADPVFRASLEPFERQLLADGLTAAELEAMRRGEEPWSGL